MATSPLHVIEKGEGTPVLLLHSSGMSGRQWRKLIDALATKHHVVAPDFIGSGENPPWPVTQAFHFQKDVDAITALAEGRGPLHLVGHSYGGFVAITFARQHPALLRSVALYDPVAFGVLHDAADREGIADLARADAHPAFLDVASGGGDAWMAAFVDYWSGPGAWLALPAAFRDSMLRVGRKVYGEVSTLLRDRTPASAYAVITAPTLFIRGEHTPYAARRLVELLTAAMPNARIETLLGAGHMGPISDADRCNALIAAHIAAAE